MDTGASVNVSPIKVLESVDEDKKYIKITTKTVLKSYNNSTNEGHGKCIRTVKYKDIYIYIK